MNTLQDHIQGLDQSVLLQYTAATGVIFVVSSISYFFSTEVGYQTVSLLLLFTVALLSLRLSIGPVITAATLSALIWNFFFIPPHFTFAIGHTQDLLMFLAYFVIAAITGVLTTRIRIREKHATVLYSLTQDLINASTMDEVAVKAVRSISSFFNVDVIIYLSTIDGEMNIEPHPSSTIFSDQKEYNVAAWVYWNERKAGKYYDTLPFARGTYYPLSGPRYPLGVIGIVSRSGKDINDDQRSLFQNFLEQISSALEREQLNELTKRTTLSTESEKLYHTLFNSISHELRTPIAAIIGAVESLRQERGSEFIDEIHTAAERLNRLVENLLDMTRLESGQLAPKLDWCDVNDLFRSALQRLTEELANHSVAMVVPEGMPLVKLDFGLMEQVFVNLLYNASLYTPPGTQIILSAAMEEKKCLFIVADNGKGFPSGTLNLLFEKFYRIPGSRTGGTGLGLSIAKGFVEAHKGTITVTNRESGGAEFVITIPVETHSPTL